MVFIFLAYFTLYNGLQFHPSHQNWFKWILFNGCVIFHGVYVPRVYFFLPDCPPPPLSTCSPRGPVSKATLAGACLWSSLMVRPFLSLSPPLWCRLLFKNKADCMYLLISGCAGSSLLMGLPLVVASRPSFLAVCAGFSLQRRLLLRSPGSRVLGLSSCGVLAQ